RECRRRAVQPFSLRPVPVASRAGRFLSGHGSCRGKAGEIFGRRRDDDCPLSAFDRTDLASGEQLIEVRPAAADILTPLVYAPTDFRCGGGSTPCDYYGAGRSSS